MAKHDGFNLLLVRAGPTAWDTDDRLGSGADLPVSEVHQTEVEARLASIDDTELRIVYHAPDRCSREIAQGLARMTHSKTKELDGLAEVDLGLWDGLRVAELEDRYPKAFKQWMADPWSVSPPQGEPAGEAQQRLISALVRGVEKLRHPEPGVCVVVRPLAYALLTRWSCDELVGWGALDGPEWMRWTSVGQEKLPAGQRATA